VTPSLSVLMPALNEAANIESAVRGVLRILDELGMAGEILVLSCVDRDGTSDGTVEIVRALAAADPRVRSLHSERYEHLGEKLRHGILAASKAYAMYVPGDNEIEPASVRLVLRQIGTADVVLCHPLNPEMRALHRRVLSRAYTALLNVLFAQRVRYYNGVNVYRTADLQAALPGTDSFALGAEMVLRQLRAGRTYIEVGVRLQPRLGRSKALRPAHVVRLVAELIKLRVVLKGR
jgi:glycosyltransferase involved in cell wall biosynthesis